MVWGPGRQRTAPSRVEEKSPQLGGIREERPGPEAGVLPRTFRRVAITGKSRNGGIGLERRPCGDRADGQNRKPDVKLAYFPLTHSLMRSYHPKTTENEMPKVKEEAAFLPNLKLNCLRNPPRTGLAPARRAAQSHLITPSAR